MVPSMRAGAPGLPVAGGATGGDQKDSNGHFYNSNQAYPVCSYINMMENPLLQPIRHWHEKIAIKLYVQKYCYYALLLILYARE